MMKKYTNYFILFCLVLCITICFTSCTSETNRKMVNDTYEFYDKTGKIDNDSIINYLDTHDEFKEYAIEHYGLIKDTFGFYSDGGTPNEEVIIDYLESILDYHVSEDSNNNEPENNQFDFIINTNSNTFHKASCSYAQRIKDSNRKDICASIDKLVAEGYTPCTKCIF